MGNEHYLSKTPEFLYPSIKAIIFDLDGLLVDTEDLWFETFSQVCNHYGVMLTEEHRERMTGRGEMTRYLMDELGIVDSQTLIQARISQVFSRLFDDYFKPMPGAIGTVKKLSPVFPIAVATSAHTEYAGWIIGKLELGEEIKVIVGGDQVEVSKPAPDIFIETAKRLQTPPSSCLVFEDSTNGLKAAKDAGMFCIVVPNRRLTNSDFSKADLQLPSLEAVDLNVIENLSKSLKKS